MRFRIQAAVVVLLLVTGVSASSQTGPICPVSITFIKLTHDRFTVKVLGHSAKPREEKAMLMATVYVVDDQNHTRLSSMSTLDESSYTYTWTGVWNTGEAVQQGRFILRIEKLQRGSSALRTPVDGCNSIERAFDFRGTEDQNKPKAEGQRPRANGYFSSPCSRKPLGSQSATAPSKSGCRRSRQLPEVAASLILRPGQRPEATFRRPLLTPS